MNRDQRRTSPYNGTQNINGNTQRINLNTARSINYNTQNVGGRQYYGNTQRINPNNTRSINYNTQNVGGRQYYGNTQRINPNNTRNINYNTQNVGGGQYYGNTQRINSNNTRNIKNYNTQNVGRGQYYGNTQRVNPNNTRSINYNSQRLGGQYNGQYVGSQNRRNNGTRKKPKRPPLTNEQRREIAERKRLAKEKLREQRKAQLLHFADRAKKQLVLFSKRFLASFALAMVFFILFTSFRIMFILAGNSEKKVDYTIYLGLADDNYLKYTQRSDRLFLEEGIPYINMDTLTDYLGFVVSGNDSQRRYILDYGESILFTAGTNSAIVNGEKAFLSGKIVAQDGVFYAPMDFFANYLSNISFTLDTEEHTVVLTHTLTETSQSEYDEYLRCKADDNDENDISLSSVVFEYEECHLLLHTQTTTDVIKEYSLPDDILAATDPNPPETEEADTSGEE